MRSAVPAFSLTTVVWLLVVGLVSFAATVLFAVFGEDIVPTREPGTNTWSVSAVGHRAFVETLRRLDVPVIVSRHRPAATAGNRGLLVLAEPHADAEGVDLATHLGGAARALVVLPKWQGTVDPENPQWIDAARLRSADHVQDIARALIGSGVEVMRPAGAVRWRTGRFGIAPTLDRPQLLGDGGLRPIIRAAGGGVLLGEVRRGDMRIWVLSDADLIANHGLDDGDNAALAVGIVEALRPAGGPVVFDETVHGFARPPDLWRELFTFPLVVVTAQALLAAALLVWAAAGRFGAAVPVPARLKAGKGALLDSTAGMLTFAGHRQPLIRRYLEVAARDVARRLHVPRHLDDAGVAAWLDQVAAMRGVGMRYGRLQADTAAVAAARRPDARRMLDLAQRIHRWKREMLRGRG